jgi:Ni,Fe-hydrogenase III small subunit
MSTKADNMKLLLVGPPMHGKTLVTHYIKTKDMPMHNLYVPTVGLDVSHSSLTIDNIKIKLIIYDSGGLDYFKINLTEYYRQVDVVCIIYNLDKDKEESLHQQYKESTLFFTPKPIIMILLGSIKPDMGIMFNKYPHAKIIYIAKPSDIYSHINRELIQIYLSPFGPLAVAEIPLLPDWIQYPLSKLLKLKLI